VVVVVVRLLQGVEVVGALVLVTRCDALALAVGVDGRVLP
jgi:hypothetical protein